jgi:hypothetical protein
MAKKVENVRIERKRIRRPGSTQETHQQKKQTKGVLGMSKALLEYKIIPRLMIFTMTVVYVRCIEWALSQPDLSTQQASLISVVTGAMTGSLAVFLNSETKK